MTTSTPPALRQLSAGLRVFLALTVVLGLVYPLAMTGIAQVLFPDNADGSLVETNGKVVGSELIGQSFGGDPKYFQSRPSAAGDGYDPLSSSASNYGPENADLINLVEERRLAAAELNGVDGNAVAADALLASGSGLDPHVSPKYAEQQVERVARERGLDPDKVRRLVDEHTSGRTLGILGESHVNVLMLNIALDDLTGAPARAAAQ
ncbi:MAG: potassium-transporting ATPase subunit KdpC [Nocardioides sp.]